MSTEIAVEQPTTVIANPVTIAETADRLEMAIATMVDRCVGQVEDEVTRIVRRRDVSAAIRGILRYKKELEEIKAEPILAPGLFLMAVDGMRPDLNDMFRKVNPTASDAAIEKVVDDMLRGYIEFLQNTPAAVSVNIVTQSTPAAVEPEKKKRSGKSVVGS